MDSIIYKDRKDNMFNDEGDGIFEMEMEIGEINYLLDNAIHFDQYTDLKPPQKMSLSEKVKSKKTYRKYKKEDTEHFFFLVNEKRMSIR
ncbi:hypothetical protein CU098_003595, partial [Rhizopus stolonifer]